MVRRVQEHPAIGVLPPVRPPGHFFVERDVRRAEQAGQQRADRRAESLDQPQADVAELNSDDFPRERHPRRRAPDHRSACRRIIERTGGIDHPGVGGQLDEAERQPEHEQVNHEPVAAADDVRQQHDLIENIEQNAGSPVGTGHERERDDGDEIQADRRQDGY